MTRAEQKAAKLLRRRTLIRPRDFVAEGLPRELFYEMVRRGELTRLHHGLYAHSEQSPSLQRSLAEAAAVVPRGVICLLSALRFHDLTTQSPSEVWVAVENKAWRPKRAAVGIQLVYMSNGSLSAGVQDHRIDGILVPIFSAAKTVADCFKYRNKIGTDVAVEALRDFLERHRRGADELWHYAKIDRVTNVIRPYLQASA